MISLNELKESYYYSNGEETWARYCVLASEYVYEKLTRTILHSSLVGNEYHNLVSEMNDYVFRNHGAFDALLGRIRDVSCEEILNALVECGLTEREGRMVLANVHEQCFLNIVQHGKGESKGWVEMHFEGEEYPLRLEFICGSFYSSVVV